MPDRVLWGRGARAWAWLVTKLRFVIVLVWVGGAVAATLFLPSLSESGGASLGGLIAEDSESVTARRRSAELFSLPILSETVVVQRDPNGLSEEAQLRVFERAAAVAIEPDEDGVRFAIPITNTARLFPGSRESSTTAITYLFLAPELSIGDQRALAEDWAQRNLGLPEDHLVGVTGAIPARVEESHRVEDSLLYIELATVLLIATILGVTFRSLGAPLVTLVLGRARLPRDHRSAAVARGTVRGRDAAGDRASGRRPSDRHRHGLRDVLPRPGSAQGSLAVSRGSKPRGTLPRRTSRLSSPPA